MNTKRKGTRNEHRSGTLLESLGYHVTRSSASLGVFDLVGISRSDFVLVQVKTNNWPGTAELEAIREFPCPPNCRKLIHRWQDRQRMPDVKWIE